MSIHRIVKVGQVWRSNDARNLRAVRVEKIRTRFNVSPSVSLDSAPDDYIRVRNIVTGRVTMLRRDQFTTGVRGWSLDHDVQQPACWPPPGADNVMEQ